MICNNCGNEVLETEKFCTHCGERNSSSNNGVVVEKRVIYEYHERKSSGNGLIALGVIGVIFGILFPLVTYCTSITGLVLAARRPDKKGLALNAVAIIIAVINSILGVILQMQ